MQTVSHAARPLGHKAARSEPGGKAAAAARAQHHAAGSGGCTEVSEIVGPLFLPTSLGKNCDVF